MLDASFQSCTDLQELFQPVPPKRSALQLVQGSLEGRLQIINLGSFLLTLLETNQALFVSGSRGPQPCTIAVPFRDTQPADPIRVQGIDIPWPGLMRYNNQLRDFDLRLAANTALASLIISKEHLNEHHQRNKTKPSDIKKTVKLFLGRQVSCTTAKQQLVLFTYHCSTGNI